MSVDLASSRRFLEVLVGDADQAVTWQTFDDDPERKDNRLAQMRHCTLDAAASWLEGLSDRGAGVFVTVNETDGNGRKVSNIQRVRALFIDQDDGPLPERWALQPSIIVQRAAQKWHAYWLMQDLPLEQFRAAQIWLACHFQTDQVTRDLPRVMRVPGFLHRKAEPVAVHIRHAERHFYTLDQILAAFPVEWAQVDESRLRAAANERIKPAIREQKAREQARKKHHRERDHKPQAADFEAANFRKWAVCCDTSEGSGNSRGGRDKTAFAIACEGASRDLPRDLVTDVVYDYMQRSGLSDKLNEAEAKVRNAYAQDRRPADHIPEKRERREQAPQERPSGRDLPPREPPPPPADDEEPAGDDDSEYDGLNLRELEQRWVIFRNGAVVPMEWSSQAGSYIPKENKRVSSLPIWPVRQGRDVASAVPWWQLAWLTPWGERRDAWVSEYDMKVGDRLIELPDAPITKRRAADAAVWLTEARSAVRNPPCEVISRLGWCGINGSRRWVWPGVGDEQTVRYIGEDLHAHGQLDAWRKGAEMLAGLPDEDGYTALAVLCLSLASPWSQLVGGRNAVIGLMCRSSSGKGSAIDYALSVWTDPSHLRLPASSTSKGIQDRAIQVADLPIFLDELQQLAEFSQQQAGDALYFMANGQRRTTSSKSQTAVGGERRHGVGFYAAEAPVLPGLNLGVHYRVIELDGMPCPLKEHADCLQRATEHAGLVAPLVAAIIQRQGPTQWREELLRVADTMREGGKLYAQAESTFQALRGDDVLALALIRHGADVLREALQIDCEADRMVLWLAQEIARQRSETRDRETVALHAILSVALNQNWGEEGSHDRRTRVLVQQRPFAWRTYANPHKTLTNFIDIDPDHPAVAMQVREYGGIERLLKGWCDRGWIERQGRNLRFKRRGAGRVVRFNRAALRELDEPVGSDQTLEGEGVPTNVPTNQGGVPTYETNA